MEGAGGILSPEGLLKDLPPPETGEGSPASCVATDRRTSDTLRFG